MRGVDIHRALPFGADAVISLVSDITEQRRLEAELEQYASAAAHDLREPILAVGFFAHARVGEADDVDDVDSGAVVAEVPARSPRPSTAPAPRCASSACRSCARVAASSGASSRT
jgi:signal transduction histidine kinase